MGAQRQPVPLSSSRAEAPPRPRPRRHRPAPAPRRPGPARRSPAQGDAGRPLRRHLADGLRPDRLDQRRRAGAPPDARLPFPDLPATARWTASWSATDGSSSTGRTTPRPSPPSGIPTGRSASSAIAGACSSTPGGWSASAPTPSGRSAHVRERIAAEGPLMTRDFEDERPERTDKAWWGWKPQKAALEYLWRTGELAIAGRVSFHKVYDLAARVLPAAHAAPAPSDGRAPRLGLPLRPGAAGGRQPGRDRRLLARRLAARRRAPGASAPPRGARSSPSWSRAPTAPGRAPPGPSPTGGSAPPPSPPRRRASACSPPSTPSSATASAPCACSASTTASRPSSPTSSASTATTCCRSSRASG